MKYLDITNVELFEFLIQIQIDPGTTIDLHNFYYCDKILYEEHNKKLTVSFSHATATDCSAALIFEDIIFTKFKLDFKEVAVNLTLDTFYRGRFEIDGQLYEYSADQKRYFYIEFLEDVCFELFASNVKLYLYE